MGHCYSVRTVWWLRISLLQYDCFFACVVAEQLDRGFRLCLAALLGEDVYNFGELVCTAQHILVATMVNTPIILCRLTVFLDLTGIIVEWSKLFPGNIIIIHIFCSMYVYQTRCPFVGQLAHPVLENLKKIDKKWLVDVLYAFNAGKSYIFMHLLV